MKLYTAILALVSATGALAGSCHRANILIGGSSDEQPLIKNWIDGYKLECTDTNLILEEVPCSSGCGARRVCSNGETSRGEQALDVGALSRPWREMEATTNNGFLFQCAETDKEIISINAAVFALAFAVGTGGVAHQCTVILGGLSTDQLRWIYSNSTREDLIATGWDPASLENDDMDDNTHLWSELDARCADEEILISGGPYGSADHQFVGVELFGDRYDETVEEEDIPINNPRPTGPDTFLEYYTSRPTGLEAAASLNSHEALAHDLALHVKNNGAAITFMKYPLALNYDDMITFVPIENKYGSKVVPSYSNILSQDYTPFSRVMHINMVNDDNILRAMKGFFEFAYSTRGKEMVEEVGFFPLAEWEEKVMLSILDKDDDSWGDFTCNDNPSLLKMAGSVTAYPVAKVWADVYRAKCNVDVKIRGGESNRGASRVCGTAMQSEVDIGLMSRNFKSEEAVTENGYEFDCIGSSNSVIQIETAIEAVVVAVKAKGVAHECLHQLGGLTLQQLRWIFSSLSEQKLHNDGWSYETIPNSDGDQSTHLWSELLDHPDCPAVEIKISGAADDTTFIDLFGDEVLPSYFEGEDFALDRPDGFFQSEIESELVQYLVENDDALSFFSYSHYAANDDDIKAVKIMNYNQEFVQPLQTSIQDGSYDHLSRRIYMNVRDDPEILAVARPYLEMGLSDMGAELVEFTGYLPIAPSERIVMKARIRAASGVDTDHLECGPAEQKISMAGSTTMYNLARLFGEIYEIGCDVRVQVDGGGSGAGADRACGGSGTPVDIGLMSREWYEEEATKNGPDVQCIDWDTTRGLLQIPVASTAIAVATASGGDAKACIDILGGLTKDQLRWIFSSYDEKQLEETGWNPASVADPDFDSETHLWSELNSKCASTEILLTGPNDLTEDIYYDFMEEVFDDYDNGERIASSRPNKYVSGQADSTAVSYLLENGAAIGFFGINFYQGNADSLSPVPIQNSAGTFVLPNESSIQDGSYDLLAKPLYMNLNKDIEMFPSTVPLVRFVVSDSGSKLVEAAGLIPIPQDKRDQILATLCNMDGAPDSDIFCSGPSQGGLSTGGIFGIIVLVVAVVSILAAVVVRKVRTGKELDTNEDANASPYAKSRTNWAQQEPNVEEPIQQCNVNQNLYRDDVVEFRESSVDDNDYESKISTNENRAIV